MIKCKVTLAGVVNKAATTHEGKDGKPFVSFGVNLPLGDKNGNCREFEVSVSADPAIATAGLLSIGKRVQVVGTLYFRKRDNTMYLNKGRTGNKSILLLSDKRKKQFQAFSAYSKEAAPDGPSYIWVHFLNFSPGKAEWLQPATSINVKGTLDVKLYNDSLDLGCQVKEITEWKFDDKKPQEEVK